MISDFASLSQLLASSLTWRGKHFLARVWSRRLKTRTWMQHLSGRIYERSTDDRFIAEYALSLEAIPVKASPSPASVSVPLIRDGSGQVLLGSFAKFSPIGAFSKTSVGTPLQDFASSARSWKAWVSALRQVSSRRRKSARPISESDSSFSQWHTPTVTNSHGNSYTYDGGDKEKPRPSLVGQAQNWPTPDAQVMNDSQTPEALMARKEREKAKRYNGNGGGVPLAMAAKLWPSPMAADSDRASGTYARGNQTLAGATKNWATPRANDHQPDSPGAKAIRGKLNHEAARWSTPRASDGEKGSPQQRGTKGDKPPAGQAAQWATPTARDWKDGANPSEGTPTNSLLGRQAPRIVIRGAQSLIPGDPSSLLSLNPNFVEWLMGWPLGWTSLRCSETESYLSKQRVLLRGWLMRQDWSEEVAA